VRPARGSACRCGAVLQPQALVAFHGGRRDVDRLVPAKTSASVGSRILRETIEALTFDPALAARYDKHVRQLADELNIQIRVHNRGLWWATASLVR
jgi:hypothetical protein